MGAGSHLLQLARKLRHPPQVHLLDDLSQSAVLPQTITHSSALKRRRVLHPAYEAQEAPQP
jgi:hypothetical protein